MGFGDSFPIMTTPLDQVLDEILSHMTEDDKARYREGSISQSNISRFGQKSHRVRCN